MPTFRPSSPLRERDAVAALALEFAILTAARSGEVLGARWREIDFDARIWTIPAGAHEGGARASRPAQRVSGRDSRKVRRGASVRVHIPWPGGRQAALGDGPAPDARVGIADVVTVHGFRSSFRDWAGNETHFPRELAEAALAHVVGDKAEQAYRRSDALEKRRALMEAWAQWCEPREAADNVTPLRRKG